MYSLHRKRRQKTIIFFGFSCVLVIITGFILQFTTLPTSNGISIPKVAALTNQLPSQAKPAKVAPPLQSNQLLILPKLNISIPVEPVGLTRSGAMDVPISTNAAGWFKLGPSPGQTGNAVIDGHNNVKYMGLGVFGRINELNIGDKITYQNSSIQRNFTVIRAMQYHLAQLPLNEIFGDTEGHHLNLITCAGNWNNKTQSYPDRLVVYAELDE